MKASTVTKLNNLLNMGSLRSRHEDRSHCDIADYVTPDHVACVRVTQRENGTKISFGCNDLSSVFNHCACNPSAKFNRKYLLEILQNMDCDYVKIRMAEDNPILLTGACEDVFIEGIVAPIIGDEEE